MVYFLFLFLYTWGISFLGLYLSRRYTKIAQVVMNGSATLNIDSWWFVATFVVKTDTNGWGEPTASYMWVTDWVWEIVIKVGDVEKLPVILEEFVENIPKYEEKPE